MVSALRNSINPFRLGPFSALLSELPRKGSSFEVLYCYPAMSISENTNSLIFNYGYSESWPLVCVIAQLTLSTEIGVTFAETAHNLWKTFCKPLSLLSWFGSLTPYIAAKTFSWISGLYVILSKFCQYLHFISAVPQSPENFTLLYKSYCTEHRLIVVLLHSLNRQRHCKMKSKNAQLLCPYQANARKHTLPTCFDDQATSFTSVDSFFFFSLNKSRNRKNVAFMKYNNTKALEKSLTRM